MIDDAVFFKIALITAGSNDSLVFNIKDSDIGTFLIRVLDRHPPSASVGFAAESLYISAKAYQGALYAIFPEYIHDPS